MLWLLTTNWKLWKQELSEMGTENARSQGWLENETQLTLSLRDLEINKCIPWSHFTKEMWKGSSKGCPWDGRKLSILTSGQRSRVGEWGKSQGTEKHFTFLCNFACLCSSYHDLTGFSSLLKGKPGAHLLKILQCDTIPTDSNMYWASVTLPSL